MNISRGSIWKKADFHIHTPYSALSNEFGKDFDLYVKTLFKSAIEKKISIIGITDYFTIEGYKRIKNDYLANDAKLKTLFDDDEISKIKEILILPNVEFRINKIVQINKYQKDGTVKTENGRINFHILFSNELDIKLIEESFLHDLDFVYEADPDQPDKRKKLKSDNLTQLGARLKSEQPEITGTDLQVGMIHAVVNDEQVNSTLTSNNDFKEKYLIVVPSDEDVSKVSWKSQDGLTRKIIISRANALFSSNQNTIEFGLGEKANSSEEFLKEFKTFKPCIWGSDAHSFDKLFEPDKQNYCWVKASPTFEGLRQILFEPKDRVFVGEWPELFNRIEANKSNYINSIKVSQVEGYDEKKGVWFKDFNLPLGLELIAIIGNKGKGKSAIADIIGLLGNAHIKKEDFSFLNSDKFCQKGYAENFTGKITWFDKLATDRKLNENIDLTGVERVKYIPQAYLEKLCNNEDSGFTIEINKVVFSRLDDSDKLGKKSFAELEAYRTELLDEQISQQIAKLTQVNKNIDYLEQKSTPEYKQGIVNKKTTKSQELASHQKDRELIIVVENPESNTSLSEDQRKKAERATKLDEEIDGVEILIDVEQKKLSRVKIEISDLENLIQSVLAQQQSITEWKAINSEAFTKYNFDIDKVISVKVDVKAIQDTIKPLELDRIGTEEKVSNNSQPEGVEEKSFVVMLNKLKRQKMALEKELEKPFKDYQEYLLKIKEWEAKSTNILGSPDSPDTIRYYETELTYLEKQLPEELKEYKVARIQLTVKIFEQKKQIQTIYNKMKEAISEVLKENSAEQNITIETSFKVDRGFYSQFFDYVNRYGVFYLNGDDEIRKLMGRYNFDEEKQVEAFLNDLENLDVRFKDNRKVDFYNYICSLSYLRPEYDLRLNNKGLSQLSPGEKGGLLLVFYLVLDKDNKPLVIDQPEDNLDNQSVAEILVPYIKRAKKLRQIIMVTHNPNLAIVADAEQIIYMNIDKENKFIVSSDAGGIEDKVMNNHIVDILEGKMKAFENRRVKYKKY
ncbi:TrlF family AAA-like ATPase [Mucilaginibacter sp. RCC_168]|uniref:TrlF family AAA-like ATPase n=1 Tax=Mucilaginibacter sp. RCC_168 TaxID=3239221 RepID=UPI0035264EA1